MNPNQLIAFEKCKAVLYQRLGPSIDAFLDHLQKKGIIDIGERGTVEKKISSVNALAIVFEWMKTKDGGWSSTIDFLKTHNFGTLAERLLESAEGSTASSNAMVGTSHDDLLVSFKSKLVEYYKTDYCKVPTLFGCHKEVGKIWVPLQIEDKTRSLRQDEIFHHQELLNRLTKQGSSSIAIVSGDPGGGKTTLVKKIVLDWANNKVQQFSVILAVPLRYMRSMDDCHNFLQMTIDYYTKKLELYEDKLKLLKALNELKHELLICLDGLDEYSSLAQSPFEGLFEYPNSNNIIKNPPSPPPSFSYKILLTSRPYACDVVNLDFFPLRLKIVSLDEAGLKKFIRYYCETSDAVEKVTRYLEQNAEWVSKVPLILTFVCSLADLPNRIPRNLTLLYETLLDNMIERETKGNRGIKWPQGKKPPNWKDLDVVKWTSRLAFDGCKNKTFAFPLNDLEDYEDSFTCGFLLRKLDFSHLGVSKIAEFPHRSIQEFFAALHCYQMISGEMSTIDETERNAIMKEIFNHDSQFRRFLFGLCSSNSHFEKMIDWLKPKFEDAKLDLLGINDFIEILSDSLSDCTEVDAVLLGDSLAASVDQLEDQILAGGNQKIGVSWPRNLTSINKSFQQGLNLNFFDENKRNWYLPLVDDSRWARLAYVYLDRPVNMRDQMDRINIIKWEWNTNKIDDIKASLDQLPPIFILNVTVDHSVDLEINLDLKYNINQPGYSSATASLQKFTFGFPNKTSDIDQLKEKFSDKFDFLVITGETKIAGDNGEIRSLTVIVREITNQSKLLKALVRLALEIPFSSEKKETTPTRVETKMVKIFVPLALEIDSFHLSPVPNKVDHELGISFLISPDNIRLSEILVLLSTELASCENEDTKKRIMTSLAMLLKLNIRNCKDLEDIRRYSDYDDDADEQLSWIRSRKRSLQPSTQHSTQCLKIFIWKHSQETQLALEIFFFCQDMRDCRRRPKLPNNLYLEETWLHNRTNEESLEPTITSLFSSRLKSAAFILPYGVKFNMRSSYFWIQIFPWKFISAKMMSLLDQLPLVFTEIIVVSSYLVDFEVTVNIEDDAHGSCSDVTQLQKFTLHFNRSQLPNIKAAISDLPDIQHLIIKEEKTSDNLTIRIRKCLDPPVSAGSLVRLAFEGIIGGLA